MLGASMPAKSPKQQRFMGADLSRKRAGKKTRTGMGQPQLEDFATLEEKTHLETYPDPEVSPDEGGFSSANRQRMVDDEEKQHASPAELDATREEERRSKEGLLEDIETLSEVEKFKFPKIKLPKFGGGKKAGTHPSGKYSADRDWRTPATNGRKRGFSLSETPLDKLSNLLDELHESRTMKKSLEEVDSIINTVEKHFGEGHEVPYSQDKKETMENAAKLIEKYIDKDMPKLGSGREKKVANRQRGKQRMKVSGRGLVQQNVERVNRDKAAKTDSN